MLNKFNGLISQINALIPETTDSDKAVMAIKLHNCIIRLGGAKVPINKTSVKKAVKKKAVKKTVKKKAVKKTVKKKGARKK